MSKKLIRVDKDNIVYYTHHQPFHEHYGLGMSEGELSKIGFLVEEIPDLDEVEQIEGKEAQLKYENGKVIVVYKDLPYNDVVALKKENEQLKSAVTEITMYVVEQDAKIMNQDAKIEQQSQAISELTILFAGGNV